MAKSRLSKYIDKIVRFKKKGGIKWAFIYCCGVHIRYSDDILMMQYLDDLGEPCGQLKQLRVFDKDNYNELVDLVICEHQYLLSRKEEEKEGGDDEL